MTNQDHSMDVTWPDDRSYEAFREWFDVEIHSIVLDASDDDIVREVF